MKSVGLGQGLRATRPNSNLVRTIFFSLLVPTETLRFWDESLTFRVAETPQESAEEIKSYARYRYPTMIKTQGNFKLQVIEEGFTDSQIIIMLGENETEKTTFIHMGWFSEA